MAPRSTSALAIAALAVLAASSRAGEPEPQVSARVVLRWKPVAQASEYELQIARDAAFAQVVVSERTRVTGYRWDQLPTSRFYWRVRSIDAAGRFGEWSEAKVIEPAVGAPALLKPPNGAEVTFPSEVELSAEPARLLKQYVFELSADPGFGRGVVSQRSDKPRVRLAVPGVGTLHWRVRGVDLQGHETAPSEVRTLRVALVRPAPEEPAADAALPWTDPPPAIQLRWRSPPGPLSFEVEVTPAGGEPLRLRADGAQAQLAPPRAGAYSWRVRALGAGGAPSEWSAPQRFTLTLAAPGLLQPPSGASVGTRRSGGAEVELAWSRPPGAASFSVEVARDGEFTSIVGAQKLAGERWTTPPLAPGDYFWRVSAEDSVGQLESLSSPFTFRVVPAAPLQVPKPAEPLPGAVVPSAGGKVALRWEPVPDAAGYEVSVAPISAMDDPRSTRAEAAATEIDGLADGDYAWRVRALDAEGNAGAWSERVRFFLGLPASVRADIRAGAASLIADGSATTSVLIRLFDSEGRAVHGAQVVVTATAGKVLPVTESGGAYQAQYVAPLTVPDGGAAWVIVRDRTYEATAKIPLSAPPGRLRVGLAAGWNDTFGALSSPYAGASADVHTSILGGRFVLGARAGAYFGGATLPSVLGELPRKADLWVGRAALLALYEHPLPALSLQAGLGPTMQVMRFSVGEIGSNGTVEKIRGNATTAGLEFAAAASRKVGAGYLTAELAYAFGSIDDTDVSVRTGGLTLTLGYQLGFF